MIIFITQLRIHGIQKSDEDQPDQWCGTCMHIYKKLGPCLKNARGCLFLFSGIHFLDPQNPFLQGFLRISFFPVLLLLRISSQERGFGGFLKIPVFSRFQRIFLQEYLRDRNSWICTGFLRIPPDSCSRQKLSGFVVGHGIGGKLIPTKWRVSLRPDAGVSDYGLVCHHPTSQPHSA